MDQAADFPITTCCTSLAASLLSCFSCLTLIRVRTVLPLQNVLLICHLLVCVYVDIQVLGLSRKAISSQIIDSAGLYTPCVGGGGGGVHSLIHFKTTIACQFQAWWCVSVTPSVRSRFLAQPPISESLTTAVASGVSLNASPYPLHLHYQHTFLHIIYSAVR